MLTNEERKFLRYVPGLDAPIKGLPGTLGRPTIMMVLMCPYGLPVVRPVAAGSFQWILPQGGVEDGETPLSALQREALEELGVTASCLHVESAQLLGFHQSAKGKLLIGVGIKANPMRLALNRENQGVRMVRRLRGLAYLMQEVRPEKWQVTETFLQRAGLVEGVQWAKPPSLRCHRL